MTIKKASIKQKTKPTSVKTTKKGAPAGSLRKQATKSKRKKDNSSKHDLIQFQTIDEIKNEILTAMNTLGNSAIVKKIEKLLKNFEQVISKNGSKLTSKIEKAAKRTTKKSARKSSLQKKQVKTKKELKKTTKIKAKK